MTPERQPPGRARSGRRPARSGTRDAIAAAARRQFAAQGYDRTTIRSVAAEAGVDPALVMHFFTSKQGLFTAVLELPFDPATVLPQVLAGDRDEIGLRVARFVVALLDDPERRSRLLAMVRAAASEPEAARLLRDVVMQVMYRPIAEALGSDDAHLRGNLVGTQIVGLALARHVVGVEPLASVDADRLVELIAPTLQRYLAEPL